MRTAVLCAIVAMVVPSHARAQSVPLTEADALARLSPDSPRLRAIRAAVDVARAGVLAAGRWPNPRLTVRPRIGGRCDREHDDGGAAVADHRPARARGAGGIGDGGCQFVAAQTREQVLTASRDRLRELV